MSIAEAARPVPLCREPSSSPTEAPPLGTPQGAFPTEERPKRPRRIRPRGDLRACIGDAAAFSVMIGMGETYFAAFALALGAGETLAGMVATLPMLIGASLQLATPWFLKRTRSYKKWVVVCASLQAAALLLMPLAACFIGSPTAMWIFVAASLYWAASQATGPAWNTWIEEIVPRRVRANFFACRARISQIFTLGGFVAGGIALEIGTASGWLLAAFVGIFLVASGCRFLSAWFLGQQSEPSQGRYQPRLVPLREVFVRASGDVGTPLVLYLLVVQIAVQISGPYFTPFMLMHQKLSYFSYMMLIGISYFGKVIALPLWGRVAHYAGARRLLWIGGTSIVPVAGLWLAADLFRPWQTTFSLQLGSLPLSCDVSAEMAYLGLIQLISGIVWAAYDLAVLLMFFEAIPRQDRASVLTFYNFGNAAAQVFGGLIGATILQLGHESHGTYMIIFGISSLARLCTVPLLRQTSEGPEEVGQPAVRVIAVRADEGAVEQPILPSLSEKTPRS